MDSFDIDLTRAEEIGDGIIAPLDRLRDADPIYWSDRQHAWLVTGHAAVAEAFRGTLPLSAGRHRLIEAFIPDPAVREKRLPYTLKVLPNWLVNTDPPHQLRLRKLMMKAFSRKMAEANRPFARALIDGLLDNAAARGEVEFMEEIARPIPAGIILRMMGLPDELLPSLKRWAYYLNAGLGGAMPTLDVLEQTEACLVEMRDLFLDEIRKREAAPGEDFISVLIAARDGTDRLTENEIIGICHLTLIAGHDTTANSLALATALLARDRDAWGAMRAAPEEIDTQLLELMRLSGVSTSMARIATADFEWRGHQISAGQVLIMFILAANRDPDVFDDPLAIHFGRSQMDNMTFAPGLHHCIGHYMAKMQLGEFFPELLRRFERVELIEDHIQYGAGISFRGPERLPLRMIPR